MAKQQDKMLFLWILFFGFIKFSMEHCTRSNGSVYCLRSSVKEIQEVLNASYTRASIVKQLSIYGGDIRHFDSSFVMPQAITEHIIFLQLLRNNISTIDENAFQYFTNIEQIEFEENRIKTLSPNTFAYLNKLRSINFSFNQIKSIERGVFSNLKYVKKIQLTGNQLTQLHHDSFELMPDLYSLDIASSRINQIDGRLFSFTPKLSILNLTNNQYESLNDKQFIFFPNLTHLMIASNKIRSIDQNVFAPLANLKYLDLARNQLVQIVSLHGLINLKSLDLSFNYLEFFAVNLFIDVPAIESLNLAGNKLIEFDFKLSASLAKRLTWINLEINRWTCIYLLQMLQDVKKVQFHVKWEPPNYHRINIAGIACEMPRPICKSEFS